MQPSHRIATIERLYPDQWVVVEVTRVNRADQALAGRVLANSPDEDEITRSKPRKSVPARTCGPSTPGRLSPKG
jgi:hypothetical protein